jgi:hypothetical protein
MIIAHCRTKSTFYKGPHFTGTINCFDASPFWVGTPKHENNRPNGHCEERSDEAIALLASNAPPNQSGDGFAPLAMTAAPDDSNFVLMRRWGKAHGPFPGEEERIEAVGPAGQKLLGRTFFHSLDTLGVPPRNIFEAAQGGLPEKGAHFIPYFPVTG